MSEKRPKAANGESSIYYSTFDQKWHGRVTMGVRDDGRADRRHVKRATETAVKTAVRRLERERDNGTARKTARDSTLDEWLTHWMDHIVGPTVRYKTLTYYRTAIDKYIRPGIGAHKLGRIEPEHIEKFYSRLRAKKIGDSTLAQVHRTLRAALNEAERRNRVGRNPIRPVRAPRCEETEIEPLTVADAQAILTAAEGERNSVRWAVALSIGLRQGEALGLQWPDITWDWHHGCESGQCGATADECAAARATGTITIRRAVQRQTWQHGCANGACGRKRGAECPQRHGGGLVVVPPKSRAGRRTVSIPPPLIPLFVAHQTAQAAERERAAELWHDEGWVFAQPTGRPIDPRVDYAAWKTLLSKAGVRDARLHDARHTAATMLLVLGVTDRAAMDVMGWSKADMVKRYQHVPDALKQQIAAQLGGLLWAGEEGNDDGTSGALVPA